MKPVNTRGHEGYKNYVIEQLREYGYSPNADDEAFLIRPEIANITNIFFVLDLTFLDAMLAPRYSSRGAPCRLPSDMFRSWMLALYLRIPKYKDWARTLAASPLYAIISGFDPTKVPGHSTFYDFEKRLWDGAPLTEKDHIKSIAKKVKKPKNASDKAEPQEGRKTAVENKIAELEKNPPVDNPDWKTMFEVYRHFLDYSAELGLIDRDNMTVAGDGTEIVTAAHLNYLSSKQLEKWGITLNEGERYYMQPFTNWGYDSHRKMHYAGYSCYLLTVRSEKLKMDLPLFPLLLPASTHDCVALPEVLLMVEKYLPDYHIHMLLLDSAHDTDAEARFIKYGPKADGTPRNILGITELNERRGVKFEYKGYVVRERGVPTCYNGMELTHCGSDYENERTRYDCPALRDPEIQCPNVDCPQRNGTPLYTHVKDNPRLFTLPARCTDKFRELYKMRTSSERCNSLIKGDAYDIEESHRTSHTGWYFVLFTILICIHVKAWNLEEQHLFEKAWNAAA